MRDDKPKQLRTAADRSNAGGMRLRQRKFETLHKLNGPSDDRRIRQYAECFAIDAWFQKCVVSGQCRISPSSFGVLGS